MENVNSPKLRNVSIFSVNPEVEMLRFSFDNGWNSAIIMDEFDTKYTIIAKLRMLADSIEAEPD